MNNHLQDFFQRDSLPTDMQPSFIEHMLEHIDLAIARGQRCLILTLTKKSSEEITNFMLAKGYKTFYLHSEIDTIDRWEIIKKLKAWTIDILVGINLLREGIDLPEVGFIAILDADHEWFLRSSTALIQNIGRAARNPHSEVVLYAEHFTDAMVKSLRETYRRRHTQDAYNQKHGITPEKAISQIKNLDVVKTDEMIQKHTEYELVKSGKVKRLKRMTAKEKQLIQTGLKEQLDLAIKERRFEDAASIRDQLVQLDEG